MICLLRNDQYAINELESSDSEGGDSDSDALDLHAQSIAGFPPNMALESIIGSVLPNMAATPLLGEGYFWRKLCLEEPFLAPQFLKEPF